MTEPTLADFEKSIEIIRRRIRYHQRKGELNEVKKIKESYFYWWLFDERDKLLEKVVFT